MHAWRCRINLFSLNVLYHFLLFWEPSYSTLYVVIFLCVFDASCLGRVTWLYTNTNIIYTVEKSSVYSLH